MLLSLRSMVQLLVVSEACGECRQNRAAAAGRVMGRRVMGGGGGQQCQRCIGVGQPHKVLPAWRTPVQRLHCCHPLPVVRPGL
jgi:hypothetical protein